MKKKHIDKGDFGYLKKKKVRYSLLILGALLSILVFYIGGYMIVKSNKNLGTIMAVISVLPLANFLTVFIAVFPHKGRSQAEYEHMRALAKEGLLDAELVVTSNTLKAMPLAYVYVHANGIIALTYDEKMEISKAQEYIEGMLAANSLQAHIKIFNKQSAFEQRLSELAAIPYDVNDMKLLKMKTVIENISF